MTGADREPSTTPRRKRAKFAAAQPVRLSDEQWAEIVRYSGLPSEARLAIEQIIDHYRNMQAHIDARKMPADLRAEIESLRKNAEALADNLAGGFRDADFYSAIIFSRRPQTGWPPRTGPVADEVALQRIMGAVSELQRLSDWLVLARSRVPRGKQGAKRRSNPAYIAAEILDQILARHTGKNLTRSRKRDDAVKYVKTVLRIADPDIGNGTIVEAIKKQIKWRAFRGKITSGSLVTIPPPNSRDKRS
jgi:hypothetical protein